MRRLSRVRKHSSGGSNTSTANRYHIGRQGWEVMRCNETQGWGKKGRQRIIAPGWRQLYLLPRGTLLENWGESEDTGDLILGAETAT